MHVAVALAVIAGKIDIAGTIVAAMR